MQQATIHSALSTVANVAIAIATVVAAIVLVHREFGGQPTPSRSGQLTTRLSPEQWQRITSNGHRLDGAKHPLITVVEFADFECPACRGFETGAMSDIRGRLSGDVAVVFHHWPLSYHRYGMAAARVAECAAKQGRFGAVHDLLYKKQDSLGLKSLASFAVDAGVPDTAALTSCVATGATDSIINADAALAEAIGGSGTPTVVVDGVRYSMQPSIATIDSLVQVARVRKTE